MEQITFLDRYRISVDDAGNARVIARSGAATTYRAVDLQSGEPVALKVLPVTSLNDAAREELQGRARSALHVEHENVARLLAFIPDKDEYVFVSELTHGETIAQWVATHGPLAPDATLRVALQVVSALQAAAFHGLTHGALEPGNILIVPGVAGDGGWPAIKIVNLDSAGMPIVSTEDAPFVGTAPLIAPQFAAPEQLESGTTDFRAEIYSLGATMCFMLTGLAPLGATATRQSGESKLPAGLRRSPRNVRELLLDMLRPNPEERPQDPVAFGERIRLVLGMLERRRPARRGIAETTPDPIATTPFQYRAPSAFRPLAIAAGLAVFAVVGTLLIAQPIRAIWQRHHDVSQIGVPVGIPEAKASPAAIVQTSPPQPAATAPQVVAVRAETPAEQPAIVQSAPEPNEPPAADASVTPAEPIAPGATAEAESARIAENQRSEGAAPPAEGPSQPTESPSAAAESSDSRVASTTTTPQEQPAASPTRSTKKTTRRQSTEPVLETNRRPSPRGAQTARFVGTTRNGEWIFDAPSGEAVLDLENDGDNHRSSKRHRHQREEADRPVMRALPADPEVRRALPPDED
jgi:hypothetical protein